MASILRMPGISADAEEAVLLEWLIQESGEFHPGDALATVETEKANVEIEADQDAVLWRTLAEPGTSVAVGAPIAVLIAVDEIVGDDASVFAALGLSVPGGPGVTVSAVPDQLPQAPIDRAVPVATVPTSLTHGRIFASPLARRIARENNVDVADIEGTGPGQRIVRDDVHRAITALAERVKAPDEAAITIPLTPGVPSQKAPARVEALGTGYTDIPHSGIRRAVARFLTQSKRDAPHFYLNATCRVDALLALRHQLNADAVVRVSINDFVVKAVAKALAEVPEMNVIWMDDAVRRYDSVDISVAIGSERGLVTPVIRSAEKLSLTEISNQVRDFAVRANEGRLKQNELEGGAFTVTNLGMFGVESFSAIINPPQAGILAVGAVIQQPVVVDGELTVGSTLTVTISVDHRPVDGVLAARWLQRFKALIENPLSILT
ncbi:dihydrolipoamide acetyltransferase family protein [Cryobacterium sp. Y11]|uniref:dihydrolipoamide acetyltransferase family protein n=1 Tax=Cryobacterium sp. Y11 TaxID=2045016 RepID=UPI000CE3CB35|nr:dihydrolipoamide acetyltransferase family protein [Cryobacterium sp. Y11]